MIRFVDLFAGTGGIRLGLEQACANLNIETQCVFSCEIDKKASHTYELNFGENPLGDITKKQDFPDFDFLLAGFPCQAFSYAGKQRGFADTRGTLFFDIERILKQKRPKYIFLENVRGLTTHDKGRTFTTIKQSLESLGYSIAHLLLNASNFGVPQNRVRIYIVGILDSNIDISLHSQLGAIDTHQYKNNQRHKQLNLFEAQKKSVTIVRDILETDVSPQYYCSEDFTNRLRKVIGNDLSKLNGYRLIDYRNGKAIHSWELGIKGDCTSNEIEFMNLLIANRRKKIFGTHQDGKSLTKEQILTFYTKGDFDKVTNSLLSKGYLSCKDERYNPVAGNMSFEVFKFLDPDSISITLTASDSNRLGIVQDNIARRLTPRECARLQGYPDSYKLPNDDKAIYKQMGNAVSVPVVQAVIEDFLERNLKPVAKSNTKPNMATASN